MKWHEAIGYRLARIVKVLDITDTLALATSYSIHAG